MVVAVVVIEAQIVHIGAGSPFHEVCHYLWVDPFIPSEQTPFWVEPF